MIISCLPDSLSLLQPMLASTTKFIFIMYKSPCCVVLVQNLSEVLHFLALYISGQVV